MFELTVSTSIDRERYIKELFDELSLEIKKIKGLAVKQNYDGRSYFSLAVPEKSKDYFKSKVLNFFVYMISDDYKYNYYKENLISNDTDLLCDSFIKAISLFDAEIDAEIIKDQIDLSGEILVDSYYYFKLNMLKKRWTKTAEVINQNQILNNHLSMVEVLKYLTQASENNVFLAEIIITKKTIKLSCLNIKKTFKRNFQGQSNFFVELISKNPAKIKIKLTANQGKDGLVEMLNEIYEDKIYYVN